MPPSFPTHVILSEVEPSERQEKLRARSPRIALTRKIGPPEIWAVPGRTMVALRRLGSDSEKGESWHYAEY